MKDLPGETLDELAKAHRNLATQIDSLNNNRAKLAEARATAVEAEQMIERAMDKIRTYSAEVDALTEASIIGE